jgi:tetratricopeptide (TPR) repeat protein
LTSVGRYDEAIGQLREAVEIDPASAAAHLNLAETLRKTGRLEEAQAHYQAAQQVHR